MGEDYRVQRADRDRVAEEDMPTDTDEQPTGMGAPSGTGTGSTHATSRANILANASLEPSAGKPGPIHGRGPGAGTGGGTPKPPVELPLNPLPPLPENKLPEAEHLDDDFDYAVTVYEAKNAEPYARVDITPKRTLQKLKTIKRDLVILID